jgi:hypothetical protein
VLAPGESSRIQIDTDAGARIEQELRDSGRLWRFDATRAAGYFKAASGAPLAGAAPPPQQSAGRDRAELRGGTILQGQARAAIRSDLLDMDDRAIIIVGGREVTAGDVKRDILQRLPPPSGTAQRVNAPPRSQPGTALIARPGEIIGGLRRAETVGVGREVIEAATAIDCNKGPLVGRMQGVVSPGETISIAGACFGSTPGSIEIIGQFSGPTAGAGPMRLDFVSWTDGEIVARTPPIQGPDQVVSLTVVRADGRRSGTKPSRFVATRERVDVPSHYWQPSPRYQWRGVFERSYDMFRDNFDGTRARNSGTAPPSDFRLRINPACALETMEAIPRLGAVTGIQGWDNPGPPHEASVRIMWQPRATRTRSEYLVGYENIYVDEIDFELRATATCPVGIRP